jgi:hypothetical protein
MSDVWIYHPNLDRYVQVPESAVGIHAMSGWVSQDPPPPEPEPEDADSLTARAEAVGLKVDGRWGLDRLQAEVEAAEAEQENVVDSPEVAAESTPKEGDEE